MDTAQCDLTGRPDTVMLFNGFSQYDLLRGFIADIVVSFESLGYRTIVVDLASDTWQDPFVSAISHNRVALYFSLNGMGNDITLGGTRFDEFNPAPLFNFYVDHPAIHIDRIDCHSGNLIVSCVDGAHVDFLESFVTTGKDFTTCFIPHGGSLSDGEVSRKPIADRNIDILFAGSYSDPDTIRQKWSSSSLGSLLDTVAECSLYDSERPLVQILAENFQENGIDPQILANREVWPMISSLDAFVRSKRR